jgi:hypothetical protein
VEEIDVHRSEAVSIGISPASSGSSAPVHRARLRERDIKRARKSVVIAGEGRRNREALHSAAGQ